MRWILPMLAVACGPALTPRPVDPPPSAERDGLTVTLEWDAAVDLDLYVTDPAWVTVYYARPDGHLAADARCVGGATAARWERARWTRPPSGRYRVGVDFPEKCGAAPDRVPYRILVDLDGAHRETTGTARLGRREPAVMELTVP
jgi:hypothetical protein